MQTSKNALKLRLTTLEWVLLGTATLAVAVFLFLLVIKHTVWGRDVQERFLVLTAQSSVTWLHYNAGVGQHHDVAQLQTDRVQLNTMGYPLGRYQDDSTVTTADCVFLFNHVLQLYTHYSVGDFSMPTGDYFYLDDPQPLLHQLGGHQECYYLRNTPDIAAAVQAGRWPQPPFYGVHYNAAIGQVDQFAVYN
ncbi:MAG: hypothetical protein V4490_03275 [Pseudomonadota bacterium]